MIAGQRGQQQSAWVGRDGTRDHRGPGCLVMTVLQRVPDADICHLSVEQRSRDINAHTHTQTDRQTDGQKNIY